MSTCHSLESPQEFQSVSHLSLADEVSVGSSWHGRRVVSVKERNPNERRKPTANEELLQKLLRRSLLNLSKNLSQDSYKKEI